MPGANNAGLAFSNDRSVLLNQAIAGRVEPALAVDLLYAVGGGGQPATAFNQQPLQRHFSDRVQWLPEHDELLRLDDAFHEVSVSDSWNSMRIGLITNVHSHAAELACALRQFRDRGVEKVITIGDTIEAFGRAAGPQEVAEFCSPLRQRELLRTGDYSIRGLEDRFVIERKSLGDFVGTVIGDWLL